MLNIITGAVSLGLLWSVMALGVYTTYRIMDYADLTVEGSLVTGRAVSAAMLTAGHGVVISTMMAVVRGGLAGCVTGLLHTKLKIPGILAGILSMIGLYSVNIRIMGRPNLTLLKTDTIFKIAHNRGIDTLYLGAVVAAVVILALNAFLATSLGKALRATGNNEKMACALGINTDNMKILGLAISNGAVALSGSLIAQSQGYADVSMGQGSIVIGLASVIIGEVLYHRSTMLGRLVSVIFGAVAYRIIIAFVLSMGMDPLDLKLFTAITVALALSTPLLKRRILSATKSVKRVKSPKIAHKAESIKEAGV